MISPRLRIIKVTCNGKNGIKKLKAKKILSVTKNVNTKKEFLSSVDSSIIIIWILYKKVDYTII